jgi:hypothetical protein
VLKSNAFLFYRIEYLCPLCRQMANAVLPLAPQLGDCAQVVRSNPSSMLQLLDELSDFLRENDQKPVSRHFHHCDDSIVDVLNCRATPEWQRL